MSAYKLEVTPMVRQLLLSTLGTLKFVILHERHPLAVALDRLELIQHRQLNTLFETIKQAEPNQVVYLSLDDEILLYTSMDITCKAYLTELGDEMQQLNAPGIKKGAPAFEEVRNTILKGCEIVMQGMRDSFGNEPDMEERIDVLEQFVIV